MTPGWKRLLNALSDGKPHDHHSLYRELNVMVHSRAANLRDKGYDIQVTRKGNLWWYQLEDPLGETAARCGGAAVSSSESPAIRPGRSVESIPPSAPTGDSLPGSLSEEGEWAHWNALVEATGSTTPSSESESRALEPSADVETETPGSVRAGTEGIEPLGVPSSDSPIQLCLIDAPPRGKVRVCEECGGRYVNRWAHLEACPGDVRRTA